MSKKIAIIGAGYTGLACAKKLTEKNYNVTIFESTNETGGMAKCIKKEGYIIDSHYRHIYRSDKYVINLIKEMNLENDLKWLNTEMAYYTKDGLYKFGTPISLIKYKTLKFISRIKFGVSIIHIKLIKDYKKIEKYTVKEWIGKRYGLDIYNEIWEPLMNGKFGNEKDKISMAWLWGKINLRSTSSTMKGEKLGYLNGSWKVLTDKIYDKLLENGCKINLNESVENIQKNKGKYIIKTNLNKYEDYDVIISTLPYSYNINIFGNLLNEKETKKMKEMKYMSAKTLLIKSKESISKYYWINIGDNNIPFVGIIEHTNMVDKSLYKNENLIYISNYIEKDSKIYKMTKEELLDYYLPYLKRINPKFDKKDIMSVDISEEEYAQPVIETDYTNKKLNYKLETGIYIANMAQIYPEDRGMNYAIKLGYEIAKQI